MVSLKLMEQHNAGLGGGVMLNPKVIFTEEKEGGLIWINLGFNVHSGTASNYRNIEYNPGGVYTFSEGKYRSLTYYTDFRFGVVFKNQ